MIADGGISANSMLGGMAYRSLAGWLTGYVVNSVWQVPVLLGAGLAAARLARRMGAAAVYRVWVGTLLLAVVLPALVDTGWNLQSAWLWVKGLMAGAGASGNVRIEVLPGQAAAGVGLAWAAAPWLLTVVCGMFGVVVLFGLARLGHGLWRVREICREAVPVKLGLVLEVLGNGFRLPRGVKLGQSATVAGPMIAGVWPAWLLVPPGFFEQTLVEDVRAAVAHELAHVRRRDFAANVVCQVLALPVSYHPAAWVLRARLAESREMACDALAAQQTGGAGSYTRSLLRAR
jgi:beta-lactamase regulating signal transducer with metallopeptidase domain